MPFTTSEITDAGKIGLDFYLKNNSIDQVAVERPLLKRLAGDKRSAPGAKQYIVEQLRYRYQSNFQWFNGAGVVTYNRRQTIEQANYAWRSAHDGFALDEDRLAQNGIIVVDDPKAARSASQAERIQLTNLIEEQTEVLRLGFQEKFSQELHRDGTQSADAVTGLDALVSLTPSTGTVGGIDAAGASNVYWRNYAQTGLTITTTTGTILDYLEVGWRACVRNGGKPNMILMGSDFLDGFRNFILKTFGGAGGMSYANGTIGKRIDAGTEMMTFHGVDCTWSPEFSDLQAFTGAATSWEKRCYFLNTNHVKLRPLEGHDMITRKPPRAYDKYEYYWGLTWRGALTTNRRNAHAVFAIA
ncbi:MAG: phage major capsid protein [Burkholderiales bacterium]|nr:phage major capsid protein [Burkholderiales bacterium]